MTMHEFCRMAVAMDLRIQQLSAEGIRGANPYPVQIWQMAYHSFDYRKAGELRNSGEGK